MKYTYLHNIITNDFKNKEPTADSAESFFLNHMKPQLGYLLLARDVLTDTQTAEVSAIRIFDTIFMLKGQQTFTYTLNVLGRVYLNETDDVIVSKVQIKLRVLDPTGAELHTEILTGNNINPKVGLNINAKLWLLQFKAEGLYMIEASISTNETDFTELGEPLRFSVKQLT